MSCLDVGYRPESYDVTCKSNVTESESVFRGDGGRKVSVPCASLGFVKLPSSDVI
jgi:hypothetical protein